MFMVSVLGLWLLVVGASFGGDSLRGVGLGGCGCLRGGYMREQVDLMRSSESWGAGYLDVMILNCLADAMRFTCMDAL